MAGGKRGYGAVAGDFVVGLCWSFVPVVRDSVWNFILESQRVHFGVIRAGSRLAPD